MNKNTVEKLYDFMHKYDYDKDANFYVDLFQKYCELEVSSIDDLKKAPKEFYSFMIKVINDMNCSILQKFGLHSSVFEFYDGLSNILHPTRIDIQKRISDATIDILPNGKNTKVLDVGTGAVPVSSMMFGNNGLNPTAIDMNPFLMSNEQLQQSFNVNGLPETKFTDTSNIDNYDMLFGIAPCEAFVPMIRNCGKHDKPYFIKMCKCGLPKDSLGETIIDYKSYLKVADPKIKFYHSFTYHLDATEEQIAKIVEKCKTNLIDDEFFNME